MTTAAYQRRRRALRDSRIEIGSAAHEEMVDLLVGVKPDKRSSGWRRAYLEHPDDRGGETCGVNFDGTPEDHHAQELLALIFGTEKP